MIVRSRADFLVPTTSIQAFRDGVDFSRPDAAEDANALGRPMLLRLLRSYQEGGHRALDEYRDKEHPLRIADQFETMIGRASVASRFSLPARPWMSAAARRLTSKSSSPRSSYADLISGQPRERNGVSDFGHGVNGCYS